MVARRDETAKDVAHGEVELTQGRREANNVHVGVILFKNNVAMLARNSDALHDRVFAAGADAFCGAEVRMQEELSVLRHARYVSDQNRIALVFKFAIGTSHESQS